MQVVKDNLRKSFLKMLSHQSKAQRQKKSLAIKKKLFSAPQFKKARFVMFYVSKKEEVDTLPMIDESLKIGKRVCVPVTLKGEKKIVASEISDRKDQLVKGPYGIYQPKKEFIKPVSTQDLDLVIVPGVAFDKKTNYRLGRGAGYYDRFLKNIPHRIPRIGLAFDFQLADRLPVFSHDVPVDKVITA